MGAERIHGARPPSYVSKATLAAELDISETTVDDYVERGILPRPTRLTPGCIRWEWARVVDALAARAPGAEGERLDPFMQGARNAAKAITERHRGAA